MSAHGLRLAIAFTMTFFLLAPYLVAQPEGRPDMPGRRPPRERVEEYKKMKLIEVLGLEEEAAVRFFAKYDKHEGEQQAIHRDMRETIDSIERMVRDEEADAELQKAFAKLDALDAKASGERQRFLKDLREILTVQQIGKLIVFERKFAERVQDIVREMNRDRMRERMKERWEED